jgi:GAF domain-containing protein
MTPTDPPYDEAARQRELDRLRVLDSIEERAYDDITRMAAHVCNSPIALISLVDSNRQWFKSRIGLQARETPRELSFCAHALTRPSEVMVVGDATQDARFAANPLVTGDPGIRFYAGAPLVTASGQAVGTLCVIDREPREAPDPAQLEQLRFLAQQVVELLEQRRKLLEGNAG